MLSWNTQDIARAVAAKNDGFDQQVTSVSFDTRSLQEGALFVPLVADNDGHDYIQQAIDEGARAAFWSRPLEGAPAGIELIQVDDTLQALQDFAKAYLQAIKPKVVAITGSNGKTTTKDMTAAVLQGRFKTHKTDGNFNNHIGLPITILQMPRDTEVVVLEMGMNHPGEIHDLSCLAEPDIAVITMVGESHIEFFEDRSGIADSKFEIIDGMALGGQLIINGDEPLLDQRAEGVFLDVKRFGFFEDNDIYPLFVESGMKKTVFATNLDAQKPVTIPLPGEYNVNNALAALSVGLSLGLSYEDMLEALADFQLTANRLEWLEGIRQSHLLNDAYNASPSSMKASIMSFLKLDHSQRKCLVLGEMGELGQQSADFHRGLAEVIDADQVDAILLYGSQMAGLYEALTMRPEFSSCSLHYIESGIEEVIAYLKANIQAEDYILFKSSFSTNLIAVVDALKV